MSQQFLGEIRLFPYGFAPMGWAYCNGQILSVDQNSALFTLLGTLYGGNGQTTFALPDMRGRAVISPGTRGSDTYVVGQPGGSEAVIPTQSQIPGHSHRWQVTRATGDAAAPGGNYFAGSRAGGHPAAAYGNLTTFVAMQPSTIALAGASQPHDNMQPSIVLAYCIALQGVFPLRN